MKKTIVLIVVVFLFNICISIQTAEADVTHLNTYLLVLQKDQNPETVLEDLRDSYGFQVRGVYRHALKGAVIDVSPNKISVISQDERVLLVEQNQIFSIAQTSQVIPTGVQRVFADENSNLFIDGFDNRINADVAVLDTGIDFDHPDLNLYNAIDCTWSGPNEGTCSGARDDGHGHGTHVAGTIGALDNEFGVVGVAPGVRLWAVKVLTNYGTGTTAQIVAGIDYVAQFANQIEVANMSLGGSGESEVMDLAIANATEAGVVFALAAGNTATDVNNYHPAGQPDAITVSALADFDGEPGGLAEPTCREDTDDTLIYFSNYGEGVTMTAPGTCIFSTYLDGGYATMSGTSMAAPHVAGAAAILTSMQDYTPEEVKTILLAQGNFEWVDDSGDGVQEPLLDLSNSSVFAPTMMDASSEFVLTAVGYKVSGWQFTDLSWTGSEADKVEIYRDGTLVSTIENSSEYTDAIGERGAGMHFYRVCEYGNPVACSNIIIMYY